MQGKLKRSNHKQSGQLLVETMVAISVLLVGMLGIFAVLSQSLALNRVASNQYIAANLAAEGIEVVKNILDANAIQGNPWNEGLETDGDFGVEYSSTALNPAWATRRLRYNAATRRYSYGSGTDTNFRRMITIQNVSSDEIKVVSRVEWTDRGGAEYQIELEDRFLNWRQDIAP